MNFSERELHILWDALSAYIDEELESEDISQQEQLTLLARFAEELKP